MAKALNPMTLRSKKGRVATETIVILSLVVVGLIGVMAWQGNTIKRQVAWLAQSMAGEKPDPSNSAKLASLVAGKEANIGVNMGQQGSQPTGDGPNTRPASDPNPPETKCSDSDWNSKTGNQNPNVRRTNTTLDGQTQRDGRAKLQDWQVQTFENGDYETLTPTAPVKLYRAWGDTPGDACGGKGASQTGGFWSTDPSTDAEHIASSMAIWNNKDAAGLSGKDDPRYCSWNMLNCVTEIEIRPEDIADLKQMGLMLNVGKAAPVNPTTGKPMPCGSSSNNLQLPGGGEQVLISSSNGTMPDYRMRTEMLKYLERKGRVTNHPIPNSPVGCQSTTGAEVYGHN